MLIGQFCQLPVADSPVTAVFREVACIRNFSGVSLGQRVKCGGVGHIDDFQSLRRHVCEVMRCIVTVWTYKLKFCTRFSATELNV